MSVICKLVILTLGEFCPEEKFNNKYLETFFFFLLGGKVTAMYLVGRNHECCWTSFSYRTASYSKELSSENVKSVEVE